MEEKRKRRLLKAARIIARIVTLGLVRFGVDNPRAQVAAEVIDAAADAIPRDEP